MWGSRPLRVWRLRRRRFALAFNWLVGEEAADHMLSFGITAELVSRCVKEHVDRRMLGTLLASPSDIPGFLSELGIDSVVERTRFKTFLTAWAEGKLEKQE